jgi:hypothetical protein
MWIRELATGWERDKPSEHASASVTRGTRDAVPTLFDSTNQRVDIWVANIFAKLTINADYYESEQACIYYVYTCTIGDAQEYLNPCYFPGNTNPFITYDEILDLLTKIYTDPQEQKRARRVYN